MYLKRIIQFLIFSSMPFIVSLDSSFKLFLRKNAKKVAVGSVVLLCGVLRYFYNKRKYETERNRLRETENNRLRKLITLEKEVETTIDDSIKLIQEEYKKDTIFINSWINFSLLPENKEFFSQDAELKSSLEMYQNAQKKFERALAGKNRSLAKQFRIEYKRSFVSFLQRYANKQDEYLNSLKNEFAISQDLLSDVCNEYAILLQQSPDWQCVSDIEPFKVEQKIYDICKSFYNTDVKKTFELWIKFYNEYNPPDSKGTNTVNQFGFFLIRKELFEGRIDKTDVHNFFVFATELVKSFCNFFRSYCTAQRTYLDNISNRVENKCIIEEYKIFLQEQIDRYCPALVVVWRYYPKVFGVHQDFQDCYMCVNFTRMLHFSKHVNLKMCKSCFDIIQKDYKKDCAPCPLCRGAMIVSLGEVTCGSEQDVQKIVSTPNNMQPTRDDLMAMGIVEEEINVDHINFNEEINGNIYFINGNIYFVDTSNNIINIIPVFRSYR